MASRKDNRNNEDHFGAVGSLNVVVKLFTRTPEEQRELKQYWKAQRLKGSHSVVGWGRKNMTVCYDYLDDQEEELDRCTKTNTEMNRRLVEQPYLYLTWYVELFE